MGLSNWSWDPSLFYVVPAAVLYALGSRPKAGRPTALQAAAFYSGLLSLVIALDSPIDAYADELLWVHMLQHVILLTVAPPLILLGRPWPTMWRALPRRSRSAIAREVPGRPSRPGAGAREAAGGVDRVQRGDRRVAHPLRVRPHRAQRPGARGRARDVLLLRPLFWARVIDTGRCAPRLQWPARIAYIVGAMIVGWVLAIVFVVAPEPIYQHYADLPAAPAASARSPTSSSRAG